MHRARGRAGFDAATWATLVRGYDLVETGAVLVGEDGSVLHVNRAARAMLGAPVTDAAGLWQALGLGAGPSADDPAGTWERTVPAPAGAVGSTTLRVTWSLADDGAGGRSLRVARLVGDAPPATPAFSEGAADGLARGVLGALDDCVVVHAPDTRILWCNDAYLDMVGRWFGARPDPARLPLEAFTGEPAQLAAAYTRVSDAFAGRYEPFVERYGTGEGTTWVEARTGPIRGADGAVIGALFFFRDVTVRERAALERDAALAEAQAAAEEAARANRAKSEFLSRMSHELRTPLNAILGFSQIMEADASDATREQLGHITDAGRHLLTLINELLDIARLESGHLTMSVEAVDARSAVTEALGLVAPVAAAHGVELQGPEGDGPVWIGADAQRLRQILLNLVGNAVKYGSGGGRCAVSIDPSQADVAIAVRDWGPGIEPEAIPRIFEPFDRLGQDASGIEGSGLGLAVARALVEAMDGTIAVASALGEGTTFTIRLPRRAAPPARVGPADAATPARPAHGTATGRILYVEDNLSNLHLVREVMRLRPGVELAVATDGASGLAQLRRRLPDLLLLDLHLPGMGGEDVLRALRADPATAALPVLVLSADVTHDTRARVAALGVTAQLPKPLDVPRLLAAVDGVLRQRPGLRVLVADDHAASRLIAERVLVAGGHAVDVVGDGEAALAALTEGAYDLALLDQEMPGLTGLEVARRVRAGTGPPPLIVLLSAHDAGALPPDEAVDHVVVKPLTRALAAHIASLVPARVPDPAA